MIKQAFHAVLKAIGPAGETVKARDLQADPIGSIVTHHASNAYGDPAREITAAELGLILSNAAEGYGDDYLALAESMEERNLHYRGLLQTRRLAVSGLQWEVMADAREPQGEQDADLVRDVLEAGIDRLVFDLMDAVGKGFAMVEIGWQTDARRWWPVTYRWTDPRHFTWQPPMAMGLQVDGRSIYMARDGVGSAEVPAYRYVQHIARGKSGLPMRGGIARAAAWADMYKNFSQTDWSAFLEIYGHPLRLGKYAPGALDEDIEILKTAVRNLSTDSSAVIPDDMLVEFIHANSKADAAIYKELCSYLDQQLAVAVLGHTGTSSATPGRLGGEDAAESVRADILADDARSIAHSLNRDLVQPVVAFNHGPRQHYPKIVPVLKDAEDLTALANQISALAPVMAKRIPAEWVAKKWKMPELRPGEASLDEVTPKPWVLAEAAQRTAPRHVCNTAHAMEGADGQQDEIDRLTEAASNDWEPQIIPYTQAVEDLISEIQREGGDLRELQARLNELEQRMDPNQLAQSLARESFKVRILAEDRDEL